MLQKTTRGSLLAPPRTGKAVRIENLGLNLRRLNFDPGERHVYAEKPRARNSCTFGALPFRMHSTSKQGGRPAIWRSGGRLTAESPVGFVPSLVTTPHLGHDSRNLPSRLHKRGRLPDSILPLLTGAILLYGAATSDEDWGPEIGLRKFPTRPGRRRGSTTAFCGSA
jgi:hypothetical protein